MRLAIFLIFFGGVSLLQGLKRKREIRKITDTAASRIATCPQGAVDLQGYAWGFKPLENPFDDEKVLYFNFKIQEERRSGKSSNWVDVFADKSSQPFAIIDNTGFAVVYPQDSQPELRTKVFSFKQLSVSQQNSIRTHLLRKGSRYEFTQNSFLSKPVRVVFQAIYRGSPINVLGSFHTLTALHTPDLQQGAGTFIARVATFKKNIVMDLKLFDKNHDGQISTDEWFEAHLIAAEASLTAVTANRVSGDSAASTGATAAAPLSFEEPFTKSCGMLSGSKTEPLLIADCHKKDLITRLSSWNLTRILVGAALVALGLTVLFFYSHR